VVVAIVVTSITAIAAAGVVIKIFSVY